MSSDHPVTTGDQLKAWRKRVALQHYGHAARGLSQAKAAKLLGMGLSGYQYLEAGTNRITDTMARLLWFIETYGPPPVDVFGEG